MRTHYCLPMMGTEQTSVLSKGSPPGSSIGIFMLTRALGPKTTARREHWETAGTTTELPQTPLPPAWIPYPNTCHDYCPCRIVCMPGKITNATLSAQPSKHNYSLCPRRNQIFCLLHMHTLSQGCFYGSVLL